MGSFDTKAIEEKSLKDALNAWIKQADAKKEISHVYFEKRRLATELPDLLRDFEKKEPPNAKYLISIKAYYGTDAEQAMWMTKLVKAIKSAGFKCMALAPLGEVKNFLIVYE